MESQLTLVRGADETVIAGLRGRFNMDGGLSATEPLERALQEQPPPRRVVFDATALQGWDSTLLAIVARVVAACAQRGVEVDTSELPVGVRRLLDLVQSAPAARVRPPKPRPSLLARVGERVRAHAGLSVDSLELVGRTTFSLGRLARGRIRCRREDLLRELTSAGAHALPIVSIVSVLLGMILAFVGSVTLRPFGATIYVANVVTVGMVRELGAVMTAIVMAGRTGSAYASELSTMNVTQETDALVTFGIEPVDFLVMPRMLALSLMMPLLYLYASAVAVIGGGVVAVGLLGLTPALYVNASQHSVPLYTLLFGLAKSAVFGILVAFAGCAEGMHGGRSAADVGRAATEAVVRSIVWIIAADGVAAVLFYLLGL